MTQVTCHQSRDHQRSLQSRIKDPAQLKEDTTTVAGSKDPFDLLLSIGQLPQGSLGVS